MSKGKKQQVSKRGIPVNKPYGKLFEGYDDGQVQDKDAPVQLGPERARKGTLRAEKPAKAEAKPEVKKGLAKLVELKVPEPAPEVIDIISTELQGLPEFQAWNDAEALQGEAATLRKEVARILGTESDEQLEGRIRALQGAISTLKSKIHAKSVTRAGVGEDRARFLEKFGHYIAKLVDQEAKKDPAYVSMAVELRKAKANAERVQELRLSAEQKEKEAQALLDSINLNSI